MHEMGARSFDLQLVDHHLTQFCEYFTEAETTPQRVHAPSCGMGRRIPPPSPPSAPDLSFDGVVGRCVRLAEEKFGVCNSISQVCHPPPYAHPDATAVDAPHRRTRLALPTLSGPPLDGQAP